MVRGKAGGMVFAVDDLMRLQRFLILGAEGGTYYTKPRKHTAENLAALLRLLKAGRGVEAVALIQAISTAGRAPKQTPTMTALALCARLGPSRPPTRRCRRSAASPLTCSSSSSTRRRPPRLPPAAPAGGAHWGLWYTARKPLSLAEAVTKYQSRGGWSHMDVLRLCHAIPASTEHAAIFAFVVKSGLEAAVEAGQAATAAAAAPTLASGGRQKRALEQGDAEELSRVLAY